MGGSRSPREPLAPSNGAGSRSIAQGNKKGSSVLFPGRGFTGSLTFLRTALNFFRVVPELLLVGYWLKSALSSNT